LFENTRIDDLRKKEGETAAREKRTKRNESNLFQRREKLSRAKEKKLPKTVREEKMLQ